MTNYNDGNWHGWNGGECPVHPKSRVGGVGYVNDNSFPSTLTNWLASDFDWENFRGAFRVTKEHKEPREWWVHPAVNDLSTLPTPGYIHVREVMEGEE